MTQGGPTGPGLHLGAAINQLLRDRDGDFNMRGWAIIVIGGMSLVFGGLILLSLLLQA